MSDNEHVDPRFGHVYRYHSRSDRHSIQLCEYIMADLLAKCPVLKEQASHGEVAYGVNIPYTAPITRKSKTFDLAVGRPVASVTAESGSIAKVKEFSNVFFTCEAKAVMTEHSKSQPRVYDELSSSHEIVHQGSQEAIATGVTVVNIASAFVSPLRQSSADELYISNHNQPRPPRGWSST